MTVSYINLMRVQQKRRYPFAAVTVEGLTVADILDRGKKAREALGTLPGRGIVTAEIAPPEQQDEIVAVVAPEAPIAPLFIVVTQQSLDEAEESAPIIDIPSWKKIVREVSEKHGVSILDMLSTRRAQPFVAARYEAMYRLRHETTMSYPAIGRRLGGRDHTTVLHGVRQHALRNGLAP